MLDNVKYQKCKAVRNTADNLFVDLVYIPPYSPNPNLIERLWKFVKGELRTKYYDDFGTFRNNIDQIVASASTNNKNKISKLIGTKVQLFDNFKQINSSTFMSTKPRGKKSEDQKSHL